jgi:hypothetical protein
MTDQPAAVDNREEETVSQSHDDNVSHTDDVMSGLKKEVDKANYNVFDRSHENEKYGCAEHGCECDMGEVEATSGRLPVVSIAEQVSSLTELSFWSQNLSITAP